MRCFGCDRATGLLCLFLQPRSAHVGVTSSQMTGVIINHPTFSNHHPSARRVSFRLMILACEKISSGIRRQWSEAKAALENRA